MRHALSTHRALVAPALLTLVALCQVWAAHTRHLTPWKGGGFGMFSTVDSTSARFTRIRLDTDQGRFPVIAPRDLRAEVDLLRALPREAAATELAAALLAERWARIPPRDARQDAGALEPAARAVALPEDAEIEPPVVELRARAVTVELWRYRYDGESGAVYAEIVVSGAAVQPLALAP